MTDEPSVDDLLRRAAGVLAGASSSPRLDAELLFAHAAGTDRLGVVVALRDRPGPELRERFMGYVSRRASGEPVAYLTGRREFYGLGFLVTPDVLVPRPETELLVTAAVAHARAAVTRGGPVRVADLGTGSGCVIISVASELAALGVSFRAHATDVSAAALAVSARNAARLVPGAPVTFHEGDWFDPLPAGLFDVVLSNPPYVPDGELLPEDVRREPPGALYGGPDGTGPLRRIVAGLGRRLAPGGFFACELGAGQYETAAELLRGHGFDPSEIRDAAGIPRVVTTVRRAR